MSEESDPISKENITKCEDSNLSQGSSENLSTMPTFQTIEIVETQDNDSTEFVNEGASLDGESNEGSEPETRSEDPDEGSESDASQDVIELDSDEANNKVKKEITDDDPNEDEIQLQDNNDDDDNGAAQSWPTLEILPGGIIRPTDNEYPYCIYVDQPDNEGSEELIYACAKCPMRFKVLNLLTMHIRLHTDEKKREEGLDTYKKFKPETEEERLAKMRRRKLAQIRRIRKKMQARKHKLEIEKRLAVIQRMKEEHMKKMEQKHLNRLKRMPKKKKT